MRTWTKLAVGLGTCILLSNVRASAGPRKNRPYRRMPLGLTHPRSPMSLPTGSSLVFLNANTTFRCRQVGYFADTESSCRLYHVCHKVPGAQSRFFYKYSFQCHNKTVFNQATLTCTNPEESLPCEMSEDFYFMHGNELDEDYSQGDEVFEDLVDNDYGEQGRYDSDNAGYEPPLDDERDLQDLELSLDPSDERQAFGRRLKAPTVSHNRDYEGVENQDHFESEAMSDDRRADQVQSTSRVWAWLLASIRNWGREVSPCRLPGQHPTGSPGGAPPRVAHARQSLGESLKRQTYSLPRGSELLLEPLRTTFQCRHDGYFADIDNNCRVYHICT
ncbi:hypothetical protein IscW_ISCW014843, partial [Ixodes scapularis]